MDYLQTSSIMSSKLSVFLLVILYGERQVRLEYSNKVLKLENGFLHLRLFFNTINYSKEDSKDIKRFEISKFF